MPLNHAIRVLCIPLKTPNDAIVWRMQLGAINRTRYALCDQNIATTGRASGVSILIAKKKIKKSGVSILILQLFYTL
jgi:hypothetical protein